MQLELTDEETRALLNLLIDVIEADRYPNSPRIRQAGDPRQVRRCRRAAAGARGAGPPLCTAVAGATANAGGA